jgi:F-type H+-transporting ATPase subunit b
MQIDWWTLGIQTVNFLIVVWLLTRFLYRPVRRIIDEREAADRKLADEATAKTEEAAKVRAEYEQKMREAEEERQAKEAELHAAMERERDAALEKAQAKADALLAETREKLAREREDALTGLKTDIASLAADLARAALASGASTEAALARAKEHFDGLAPQDLSDLKADVDGSDEPLRVTTPAPLADAQRAAWQAMLTERLGSGVQIAYDERPDLLGGAELHFPHAVLDLSVAANLRAAADRMKV